MRGYFNEIVQRKPVLASQETVSSAENEAEIGTVNSVRSNVAV